MYRSLRENRLPKKYPLKPFQRERVKQVLRRVDIVKNRLILIKPLAIRKAVAITDAVFSGYRMIYRNAYVGKSGDSLTYNVTYKNQLSRPTMAKIKQGIGDVQESKNILFKADSSYTFTVVKTLTDPASLTCFAEAVSELGVFNYDSVTQTYNVGLFDDRYKPVSEYPAPDVDNAVLDIAYSWSVKNTVYPTPLPSGLSFGSLSVELISGFIGYEEKNYKDPALNNIVRIKARIVNNTGARISYEHWGLPVSVLYEDDRHISQVNVDVSFPSGVLDSGKAYSYYLDIPIPAWCYGKVAIAHAINFYKDGMYIYGGGPFYCFEVFRLRLP
jgi:hypothetical protein